MKILILGTSNSRIRGGWVDGLKSSRPDAQVINHSVGSSPGTQFAWIMTTDLSQYDYVFLDTVPNEEKLWAKIGTDQFAERVLFEIISTIAAQTRLICLGICLRTDAAPETAIYRRRREMAAACGAQFIDIRGLTHRFAQRALGPHAQPFESEAHPDRRFAFLLGQIIGFNLHHVSKEPVLAPKNYQQNFRYLSLTEDWSDNNVRYVNNSMDAVFRAVSPFDAPIQISDGRCIGFYCNRLGTRASLALATSDGEKRFDVWHHLASNDRFELIFVPIPDGITITSLRVTELWPATGTVTLRTGETINYERMSPQLQISTMMFWNGQLDAAIPAAPSGTDCDRLGGVILERLQSILDSDKKLPPDADLDAGRPARKSSVGQSRTSTSVGILPEFHPVVAAVHQRRHVARSGSNVDLSHHPERDRPPSDAGGR